MNANQPTVKMHVNAQASIPCTPQNCIKLLYKKARIMFHEYTVALEIIMLNII